MSKVALCALLILAGLVASALLADAKPQPPGTVTPWPWTRIVKPTPAAPRLVYLPWIAWGCPACGMKGTGNE